MRSKLTLTELRRLHRKVRGVAESDAGYSILGNELGTWLTGGCCILAKALHRQLPGSQLYAVSSEVNAVEHVVVGIGQYFMDIDVVGPAEAVVANVAKYAVPGRRWSMQELPTRIVLGAIDCSPTKVRKLSELLRPVVAAWWMD